MRAVRPGLIAVAVTLAMLVCSIGLAFAARTLRHANQSTPTTTTPTVPTPPLPTAAPPPPAAGTGSSGPVTVVQTDLGAGQGLAVQSPVQLGTSPPAAGVTLVTINDTQRYQQVTGFGASMTDSSAWLLERELPPDATSTLMRTLFSPSILHLAVVRVPIGASDFTVGKPYTYDDMPPGKQDPKLEHFSIAHDRAYILPALNQARALNPQLQFIAAPWTAPAWMKGNHLLSNVHDRGTLRAAAYGPWAAYIIKFMKAYAAAGIPISGFTPANEPGNPTKYPGMNFNPTAESHWITQWLVPALVRAHLHPQLYGTELGWNSGWYAQQLLTTPSSHDLAGISWHCYYGSPTVMTTIHNSAPKFGTIVDECSPGISAIPIPEVLISSLRNWASSVALWNVALDQGFGPVQQPNKGCPGCYGLIDVNDETHTAAPLSDLFQLGQASEFVQPGAYVVAANNFVAYNYARPGINFISSGLDDVAFVNPNGTRVLIAYNNAPTAIPFAVSWHGQYFQYTLQPGAMTTFEWASTA